MKIAVGVALAASLAAVPAATAQTADALIEKSVAALGGRAAHGKLKSRLMSGTIVLETPGGEIRGTIEVLTAAPNRSRAVIKADLTALGAGPLVMDQRFDGHVGYVLDSLQGNREITGTQLDNLKNGSFPHPFLDYKAMGISAKAAGKETVGDREVHVVLFDPASGPMIRHDLDVETMLPRRTIVTVGVPQLNTEVEQTTEFFDYREVDGVKLPFRVRSSSSIQTFTITIDKVEHNVAVDAALFTKPAP